jgi:hypothetical protein
MIYNKSNAYSVAFLTQIPFWLTQKMETAPTYYLFTGAGGGAISPCKALNSRPKYIYPNRNSYL